MSDQEIAQFIKNNSGALILLAVAIFFVVINLITLVMIIIYKGSYSFVFPFFAGVMACIALFMMRSEFESWYYYLPLALLLDVGWLFSLLHFMGLDFWNNQENKTDSDHGK